MNIASMIIGCILGGYVLFLVILRLRGHKVSNCFGDCSKCAGECGKIKK